MYYLYLSLEYFVVVFDKKILDAGQNGRIFDLQYGGRIQNGTLSSSNFIVLLYFFFARRFHVVIMKYLGY